jgi:hypothetical protein
LFAPLFALRFDELIKHDDTFADKRAVKNLAMPSPALSLSSNKPSPMAFV